MSLLAVVITISLPLRGPRVTPCIPDSSDFSVVPISSSIAVSHPRKGGTGGRASAPWLSPPIEIRALAVAVFPSPLPPLGGSSTQRSVPNSFTKNHIDR